MPSIIVKSDVKNGANVMELVRREEKADGVYAEVEYEEVAYVVFQYTSRTTDVMKAAFVMEKRQYDEVMELQKMTRGNKLIRMNTSDGYTIGFMKPAGSIGWKKALSVLYDGCSGLFRNGINCDFRPENVILIGKRSPSSKHMNVIRYDDLFGHAINPIYLPQYISFHENMLELHITNELGQVLGVEPTVIRIDIGCSIEVRKEVLKSMIRGMKELIQRWKEHSSGSEGTEECANQHSLYFEFLRVARMKNPLTYHNATDVVSILRTAITALRQPLEVAPQVSSDEKVEAIVEKKESAPLIVAGEARVIDYEEQKSTSALRVVSHNGMDIVIFQLPDHDPIMMDVAPFLAIHGVDDVSKVKKNKIAWLRNGYLYIQNYTTINGKSCWEYLHRYIKLNFSVVDGKVVKQDKIVDGSLTVDHINRVTSDNRLSNLRFLTQQHQNYNQRDKQRTENAAMKKYFNTTMKLPRYIDIQINNVRNGTSLYTSNLLTEDFNVLVTFSMKFPRKNGKSGGSEGVSLKTNMTVEMKKYWKERGEYDERLCRVNPEHMKLCKDHQSHHVVLFTLPFNEEEKKAHRRFARQGIVDNLKGVMKEIKSREKLDKELNLRAHPSKNAAKYKEYIDLCVREGFCVTPDEKRFTDPSFYEPYDEFISALEGIILKDELDRAQE